MNDNEYVQSIEDVIEQYKNGAISCFEMADYIALQTQEMTLAEYRIKFDLKFNIK